MFFTNVCKCSSPNNSQLTYDEIKNCVPFLERQLEIVKPKIILTFSSEAKNLNILKNYNNVFNFYHPSYFVYSKDKNLELEQNNKIQTIISKHYY
jgi:uracil-DNA glycosylase